MTKYGKYESDGLWSIQRKTWAMVDKMNEMDCGRWNEWDGFSLWKQRRWSRGEII